jgi:hypothetical protein
MAFAAIHSSADTSGLFSLRAIPAESSASSESTGPVATVSMSFSPRLGYLFGESMDNEAARKLRIRP